MNQIIGLRLLIKIVIRGKSIIQAQRIVDKILSTPSFWDRIFGSVTEYSKKVLETARELQKLIDEKKQPRAKL